MRTLECAFVHSQHGWAALAMRATFGDTHPNRTGLRRERTPVVRCRHDTRGPIRPAMSAHRNRAGSHLPHAAIDMHFDARNETGFIAQKKDGRCCDLFWAAMRPSGIGAIRAARTCSGTTAIMAVSVGPGARALTRMPRVASSSVQVRA